MKKRYHLRTIPLFILFKTFFVLPVSKLVLYCLVSLWPISSPLIITNTDSWSDNVLFLFSTSLMEFSVML